MLDGSHNLIILVYYVVNFVNIVNSELKLDDISVYYKYK